LQSLCPATDDPDILNLLDLVAATAGAPWAELKIRLETGSQQRYSRGTIAGEGSSLQLSTDSFEATLRIGVETRALPDLAPFVTFSLDKILKCRRYHEQLALLRGALDTTTIAVLLFDTSGGIVYANSPADQLLSRQTEDGLSIEGSGQQRQPLVTFLLSTVEKMTAAQKKTQPPWTETLTLSDGSVLACEIMHVDTGGRVPSPGILAFLQPVPALSKLCLESFCARHNLSPREEDVVRLLFEGLTTSAMADRLNISLHTVRDHLKRLYRKTGARSRSELLSRVSSPGAPAIPES
jgi:DNA-binding CsgD family transcriptional regulator/PAS domain-containing protein